MVFLWLDFQAKAVYFLCPRPLFDFVFTLQGVGSRCCLFGIYDPDRYAHFCIGRSLSAHVFFKSFGGIFCDSRVEGCVVAYEDIDVPRVFHVSMICFYKIYATPVSMIVIRRFLLWCIIVVVSLGAAEGVLRLLDYPYIGCTGIDDVAEYQIGQFDPDLGWSYLPSHSVDFWDTKTYTFSREGFRAKTTTETSDRSKPTILIVGDSFLFGHGLNMEETFGYKLDARLLHRFNVLNFAVQGYGLDQVYLRLQQLVPAYAPVFVVVDIHEDQDYRNVNRDRRSLFPCSRLTGTKPMFTVKNNRLVQMYRPERFETYDNPRLRLLVRRAADVLRQRADGKIELSRSIYTAMKRYVEERGASLFEIHYDLAIRDYQTDTRSSSVSAIVADYGKEFVVDGVHPNDAATTRMVEDFLATFGAQIRRL